MSNIDKAEIYRKYLTAMNDGDWNNGMIWLHREILGEALQFYKSKFGSRPQKTFLKLWSRYHEATREGKILEICE